MKRFKSFNEAAKVDDISVGVKKKKPAGVKADEPLKGYAYNEDEQEEKFYVVRVQGKGAPGRDYINVKTQAVSQKAALEKIRNQYPGRVSYSIVKEDFKTQLSLAIEEVELDEALSPKEKEKRLQMIKKAVEKINRANVEKVKRMAMRDMKASGMFDDVIDEEIELEEDDDFRPSEQDIKRNTYLRYNVKQLEPMMKDALKAHDENEHMKRASEQHYRQTGRYLPNESPDDYQKRKKKLENKLKLLQRAYAAAKVRRQRLLKNKQTNESLADDAPLTRKSDDGKHVQLHKDRKIMSAIRKGLSDHEKKHMGRAYRDDTDIVHRDTGKTMASIHGKTVDQARSEIRKHIAKHHPETQKAKFGDVENVSSTRKIYTVRDEAEVERIKDKYKKATDGKYTVRPMKRKEGFKVYVDKKVV